MFRSVLSVVAGIVVLTVASFAIEAAIDPLLLWAFPEALPNPKTLHANEWVMVLTYAYGFLCVAFGGYVTGRLARRLPIRHAVAMGIVQAMLTIAAMFSPESNHASTLQWVLIAVLSVPAAVAGGVLYKRGRKLDEGLEKTPARA
jgi:MFS family permease